MKTFLMQFFTWWNGQTLGTRFAIWRKGELVGEDEQGNRYYRFHHKGFPLKERRWVIYNGLAEPTRIPPGWYGWMHHRTATPPDAYTAREWQKPHLPNLTGTPVAYRPKGSLAATGPRPHADGDYEPWTPN